MMDQATLLQTRLTLRAWRVPSLGVGVSAFLTGVSALRRAELGLVLLLFYVCDRTRMLPDGGKVRPACAERCLEPC